MVILVFALFWTSCCRTDVSEAGRRLERTIPTRINQAAPLLHTYSHLASSARPGVAMATVQGGAEGDNGETTGHVTQQRWRPRGKNGCERECLLANGRFLWSPASSPVHYWPCRVHRGSVVKDNVHHPPPALSLFCVYVCVSVSVRSELRRSAVFSAPVQPHTLKQANTPQRRRR